MIERISSTRAAVACATISGISVAAAYLTQSTADDAPSSGRYLPQYNSAGELLLPKNFHEWVFVGSPLTSNALNGG